MVKNQASVAKNALLTGLMAAMLAVLFLLAIPSALAVADEAMTASPDAVTVALDDGEYLMPVTLEGGSGRASVTSPTLVSVTEGKAMATIEWSSPHYDYMIVAGEHYLPTNSEGNSVFLIPMLAIDEPFEVVADTTAMSQPHEITYQLTFDSTEAVLTTHANETGRQAAWVVPAIVLVILAVVTLVALRLKRLRDKATQS